MEQILSEMSSASVVPEAALVYRCNWPGLLVMSVRSSGVKASAVGFSTDVTSLSTNPCATSAAADVAQGRYQAQGDE